MVTDSAYHQGGIYGIVLTIYEGNAEFEKQAFTFLLHDP